VQIHAFADNLMADRADVIQAPLRGAFETAAR
jgi:hypothetical protein